MENHKCPVCRKPDIPNYHEEDVVCPQCKSDLSIYRVINQIPSSSGKNIWKPMSAVAILAAAVCAFLWLQKPSTISEDSSHLAELTAARDSITTLLAQVKGVKENIPEGGGSFNYIVRKGDSYWSICKKFYGSGTKAQELAEKNNRTMDTPLYEGDTLKIN